MTAPSDESVAHRLRPCIVREPWRSAPSCPEDDTSDYISVPFSARSEQP